MDAVNVISHICDLHIILPVYNTKKYIKQCIDSIVNQKTKYTFMVTIIDDGSTDGSERIIDSYATNNKVNIIHQKNRGFSGARNRGISKIWGRYIMFVDSDDILHPNAIEHLLDKAFYMDADIVEGSCLNIDEKGALLSKSVLSEFNNKKGKPTSLRGQPWGKVIRVEIFKDIKFPEGFLFEDSIFSYCIYPKWQNNYTISNFVYEYRKNTLGVTQTCRKSNKAIDHYWIMNMLWIWNEMHLPSDANYEKRMLKSMTLGQRRCELLGEDVTMAGFVFLRKAYIDLVGDVVALKGRWKKLDRCVRKGDYGKFKVLSKYANIIYS